MLKFKALRPRQFQQHILNLPKNSKPRQDAIESTVFHINNTHNFKKRDQGYRGTVNVPSTISIRTTRTLQKTGRLQKQEVFNRHITKEAEKRMKRFRTEEPESVYKNRMQGLKQHVNDINFKCNAVKKTEGNITKSSVDESAIQERRKFLMSQVSFTQIDEEKIAAQKKYLSRFEHLSKSLPKMANINVQHLSPTKESEEQVMEGLKAIDRVYSLLVEMEREGYVLRNNKYVIQYCVNSRGCLKKVFLHESDEKKDAFTILVKYYVIETAEEAKTKFAEFAGKARSEDMRIMQEDIQGLYEHLQHSLTQKKLLELTNITNYIQCRMREEGKYLSRSLRFTTAEQDKTILTQDIALIEEKYGAMRQVSKISRRRYDQLNRTYSRLQGLSG